MKKIILTLLCILILNCRVNALDLFGLKAEYKKTHQRLENSLNKQMSDISAELGVIKNNQINLKNELKADIKATAKVVGYDKSLNQEQKAGRDVNIINDTGFLKILLGALTSFILALMTIILFVIRELFRYMKQKKEYKKLYYELKNGGKKK